MAEMVGSPESLSLTQSSSDWAGWDASSGSDGGGSTVNGDYDGAFAQRAAAANTDGGASEPPATTESSESVDVGAVESADAATPTAEASTHLNRSRSMREQARAATVLQRIQRCRTAKRRVAAMRAAREQHERAAKLAQNHPDRGETETQRTAATGAVGERCQYQQKPLEQLEVPAEHFCALVQRATPSTNSGPQTARRQPHKKAQRGRRRKPKRRQQPSAFARQLVRLPSVAAPASRHSRLSPPPPH